MLGEIMLLTIPGAVATLWHSYLCGARKKNQLWVCYVFVINFLLYSLKAFWEQEAISSLWGNFCSIYAYSLYGAVALLLAILLPGMVVRDGAISMIRMIATLLVFLCHALEHTGYLSKIGVIGIIGNYCSVGVPMFLLMSGYLYGKREYEHFGQRSQIIFRGFKKVLTDYYVYAFIMIVPLYWFIAPETVSVKAFIYTLMGRFSFPNLVHFWYIPYILFCYLITPLLYDIKGHLKEVCHQPPLFILVSLLFILPILLLVYNGYFRAVYLSCYIIGFFLSDILQWYGGRLSVKQLFYCTTPWCFVLNGVKLYLKNISKINNSAANILYDIAHVVFAIELCLGIVLVYRAFPQRIKKARALSLILAMSDQYSYDFYIVHMLWVKGLLSVMGLTRSYVLNIGLALMIGIANAMVLRNICICLSNRRSDHCTKHKLL